MRFWSKATPGLTVTLLFAMSQTPLVQSPGFKVCLKIPTEIRDSMTLMFMVHQTWPTFF